MFSLAYAFAFQAVFSGYLYLPSAVHSCTCKEWHPTV